MTERKQTVSAIGGQLIEALASARGHFLFESGQHGDLWLDLDQLLLDPVRTSRWTSALAESVKNSNPEVICGPLTGGAFVAQLLAVQLGASFVYSAPVPSEDGSVDYTIPGSLMESTRKRRVLLVDDAINAGSAVVSTLAALRECGGKLVGFACLIALGDAAAKIAEQNKVSLHQITSMECNLWAPDDCPLCRSGNPLLRTA